MQRPSPLLAVALLSLTAAAAPAPKPSPPKAADPVLLAGATPSQVEARLGKPAVASAEGKGALWTYRLERCALMVFFKDQGRGLRVTGLTAGGRRRGDPAPEVGACLEGAG